jgi:hypothetical protein
LPTPAAANTSVETTVATQNAIDRGARRQWIFAALGQRFANGIGAAMAGRAVFFEVAADGQNEFFFGVVARFFLAFAIAEIYAIEALFAGTFRPASDRAFINAKLRRQFPL